MTNSSSRTRRRKLVAAIREEGRRAFHAGIHPNQNPYKYADATQWATGWMHARDHEPERALPPIEPLPLEAQLRREQVRNKRLLEELHELRSKHHQLQGAYDELRRKHGL